MAKPSVIAIREGSAIRYFRGWRIGQFGREPDWTGRRRYAKDFATRGRANDVAKAIRAVYSGLSRVVVLDAWGIPHTLEHWPTP